MRPFLALFALLLGIHASVPARQDTVVSDLTKDLPAWMAANHVPCAGVGLIDNGRIVWIKVFGNLQKDHPAAANTLFNIASQTKPVTAMLVLRLVNAGMWSLDEPLEHYWVDPDVKGDPNLGRLTTRTVLTHQSGFPNWRTDNGGTKLRFLFEPGTRFAYSGEGFEYLRHALENKFHQPLDRLMDVYLFAPLGMTQTQYWNDRLDTNRFAMWHDGQGNRYPVSIHTTVSAADDLITTVEDYCKFGIATMNGLALTDTLFQEMTRPAVKVKENYYRCLGWGLVEGLPGGTFALEHGGSDIGVRTMAVFLPGSRSGVVVMTNGDNGMFVTDQVIRRALPSGAQILATMNKGALVHHRINLPAEKISRWTGIYEQPNGKVMNVAADSNGIRVSGDGVPTAVLFPESENSFFLDGYDVQLEFTDDHSLVIHENGRQVMKLKRR